jgi:hypothetical protein
MGRSGDEAMGRLGDRESINSRHAETEQMPKYEYVDKALFNVIQIIIQNMREVKCMKERLSVTIDSDLVSKIRKISQKEKIPQSKIIGEAVRLWERSRIESLMRKGYKESSDEDLHLAEFDLEAGNEVME